MCAAWEAAAFTKGEKKEPNRDGGSGLYPVVRQKPSELFGIPDPGVKTWVNKDGLLGDGAIKQAIK